MTTVNGWTAEQWTAEVKNVRDAMRALGVTAPACLPGERFDCGESLVGHYVTYLALLNAHTVAMAEHALPTAGIEEFRRQRNAFIEQYDEQTEPDGDTRAPGAQPVRQGNTR